MVDRFSNARRAAALTMLIAAGAAASAQQADRARTEALSRRAADRLQALQREADRLASDEQTLLGDLRKLEVERQLRAEQFKQADAQVRTISTDVASANDRVRQLEEQDLA